MVAQLLFLNLILLCYYFLCVWDVRSSASLSLYVFPSLPPLWFSLSLPNQEIWPLTLQLNAIKLLSILHLVASQGRQCSLMQSLISALTRLYIFLSYSLGHLLVWCLVPKHIEALKIDIWLFSWYFKHSLGKGNSVLINSNGSCVCSHTPSKSKS